MQKAKRVQRAQYQLETFLLKIRKPKVVMRNLHLMMRLINLTKAKSWLN